MSAGSVPSTAAQVIISIIPVVGIVMGCIVIFYFLYFNNQQKILMIEKGIVSRKYFDLDSFSLFSGLILSGIGLSLVIFFIIKDGFTYGVLSGLIPLSIGVSLLLFFIIRIKMNKKSPHDS